MTYPKECRIFQVLPIAALAACLLIIAAPAPAQTYSVLHSFAGQGDGSQPFAGLTIDRAGNLYGTTYFGNNAFKMAPKNGSWTFATLVNFTGGANGQFPDSRLFIGPQGALYGTTVLGGAYGAGVVYKLAPPLGPCHAIQCPWIENVLISFNYYDGTEPSGDLAFDSSGNLYGTAGLAFELTPGQGSWTETILSHLSGAGEPFGGLSIDSAGNLFGTGYIGDGGTVYELSYPSHELQVLHTFNWYDGADAFGGVIFDAAGNLYGAAMCGGANGKGDIFEMSPSGGGWTFNILYSFTTGDQNYCGGPYVGMTMDAAGNIYGTTHSGGTALYGSVFRLSPGAGGWTYTDLHDFCASGPPCNDGQYPFSNVVLDSQGNLYGTASQGGAYGGGVVWKLTP